MDINRKVEMLRARAAGLALADETMDKAVEVLRSHRVNAKLADALRKEWLNDMVSHPNTGEYRLAASDPNGHFLRWLDVRAQHRYHVGRRTVTAVADKYGAEAAGKLSIIVWPQEIAWAQRMRLDPNHLRATKAAIFLRESEGNPSKTFMSIADIYTDAVMVVGYLDSPVQEMSPHEIRFAETLPEFSPLFLRYAARAYADRFKDMTQDMIVKYAQRAGIDEREERRLLTASTLAKSLEKSPMRRSISTIRMAIAFGLNANDTYLLEKAFIRKVENAEIDLDAGMRSIDAGFVALLADKSARKQMIDIEPLPDLADYPDQWDIAHLDSSFIQTLPSSYKALCITARQFSQWQEAIIENRRPCPYDQVSDIAFFVAGGAA